MSILIKGMEMPQEKKITLTIFPDGRVYENHGERLWGHGEDCIPWKAVSVPPHGRLIEEADAIETAWMILRGLGYFKEENPQLEQTVREVFATAPAIEVE